MPSIPTTSERLCAALREILREARIEAGISLQKTAARAGLNRQAVAFIESGDRIPSIDTFTRLALALSLDPAQTWQEAQRRSRFGSL